jgi:hypothetical protein
LIFSFESKQLMKLTDLDISNNKLGDKLAKELVSAILKPSNDPNPTLTSNPYNSNLKTLNLSRNLLGFKTGAFIMSLLVQPHTNIKLQRIDL